MITVVANLKGGTGKSTVNFNLAVWLANKHYRVKIIDLDPQRTLSDVVEVRNEEGYLPKFKVDNHLDSVVSADFDEVLIDIGISDMEAVRSALKITERLLIPVPPSQADVWSTQRFLKIVRDCRQDVPTGMPEILGFINRADTHPAVRETEETIEALKMLPEIRLLEQKLYQRTAYRRSFSEGLAVFELSARGKAADEINGLAQVLYT